MKFVRIILSAMVVLCALSSFSPAKKALKPVYAFGVSASFTDSVVYFTEVQLLDSAVLDKNGFLTKREAYSYQLKNHLEESGAANRTCATYFSKSKSDVIKEFSKLSAKYKKNKEFHYKLIEAKDFHFKKISE